MSPRSRSRQYTIAEAAKKLGVSAAAVYRAIKQGRLEADRGKVIRTIVLSHGWKISEKSLHDYRVSHLHQWTNCGVNVLSLMNSEIACPMRTTSTVAASNAVSPMHTLRGRLRSRAAMGQFGV